MQSQGSKIALAIVLTAIVVGGVVGGGVYYWQNKAVVQGVTPTATVNQPQQAASESATKAPPPQNLFELAKNTDDEFTYLISAPKLTGDWKMTVNHNFKSYVQRFAFTYKYSPWGEMRYFSTDLTATDGAGLNELPGVTSYSFCASQYACDEIKHQGMGFDLTFWNAKFLGRAKDPKFYLKGGEIFLKETDTSIVTYKPFTYKPLSYPPQSDIEKEAAKLMSSFELY